MWLKSQYKPVALITKVTRQVNYAQQGYFSYRYSHIPMALDKVHNKTIFLLQQVRKFCWL